MSEVESQKCFVVMPYGKKSFNDGSGRSYDFDKVYRVIIRRAIKLAELDPMRADEQKGTSIIYTDMFRDLRDRDVVLADLSLENPNVFYELGIRHTMHASGTVLMCRAGSELPFDVKLSRVVFYKYNGQDLDWEEAERVVNELQFALQEAKRHATDSPVHTLLEHVVPEKQNLPRGKTISIQSYRSDHESLTLYQRLVADFWSQSNQGIRDLKKHTRNVFGARALAHLCLGADSLPEESIDVADSLYYHGQFNVACEIYHKLFAADALDLRGKLRYASSISEKGRSLAGIEKALDLTAKVTEFVTPESISRIEETNTSPADVAWYTHWFSGMLLWKWQHTKQKQDLDLAIEWLELAHKHAEKAAAEQYFPTGRIALIHLRLLVMLRERAGNPERADAEQLRDTILGLVPIPNKDRARDVSYLRWYQAIALADMGDGDGSRRVAMFAYSNDARIMHRSDSQDIGRRQYSNLRRFIEMHSTMLRHHECIAQVSQFLLAGHEV